MLQTKVIIHWYILFCGGDGHKKCLARKLSGGHYLPLFGELATIFASCSLEGSVPQSAKDYREHSGKDSKILLWIQEVKYAIYNNVTER
jgi:hypothetical protein